METHETNMQDPMENTAGGGGALQDYVLASPGSRLGANIIDSLVMWAIWGVAGIFIGAIGGIFGYILGFLIMIAGVIYAATKDALPFLDGQSIGKKVLKIRVVDEDTQEHITGKFGKSFIRILSLGIPIVQLIDIIFIFNEDKRHQRMGDQWAKTIVVREQA